MNRRHRLSPAQVTEIVVVILLSLILSVTIIPKFLGAQSTGKIVEALSDMRFLHQAFESYFADYGDYPPDFDSGNIPGGYYRMSEIHTYNCLTTPVAYVTHIPYDVFLLQPGAMRTKADPYYEYAGPGVPNLQMKWKPSGTRWTMTSVGPDLKRDYMWDLDHNQALKAVFNVTNGINSRGDLYASNLGVIDSLKQ